MLLEAPQIWRMKRYNVLETELVYSECMSHERNEECDVMFKLRPLVHWLLAAPPRRSVDVQRETGSLLSLRFG